MGKVALRFTSQAQKDLAELAETPSLQKRLRAVRKALGLLETNQRHPSLQTHAYRSLSGPRGETVFEAYAENRTPAAYRIFWFWGPNKDEITVVAITPHP